MLLRCSRRRSLIVGISHIFEIVKHSSIGSEEGIIIVIGDAMFLTSLLDLLRDERIPVVRERGEQVMFNLMIETTTYKVSKDAVRAPVSRGQNLLRSPVKIGIGNETFLDMIDDEDVL
jgi:hypothetical protein